MFVLKCKNAVLPCMVLFFSGCGIFFPLLPPNSAFPGQFCSVNPETIGCFIAFICFIKDRSHIYLQFAYIKHSLLWVCV